MGEKNEAILSYLEDNARFADLMNGAMTPEQWSQKVEASFTEVANTAAG